MRYLFPLTATQKLGTTQTAIANSTAGFAINQNGFAYAWGTNSGAILGNNTLNNSYSPVSVVGGRQFSVILSAITTANTMIALELQTGHSYTWGSAGNGLLGNNSSVANQSSPVSVVGGRSFSKIFVTPANVTAAAIEGSTGNAYMWGGHQGGLGNLGNNDVASTSSPVSVFGGRSYSTMSISGNESGALEASTGNAYCWGQAASGQLGNNQIAANASTPVSVFGARSFTQLFAYNSTFLALDGSGNCYGWGANAGQIGDNTASNRSSPTSTVGGRSFTLLSPNGSTVAAIEGSTGNVYCWGVGTGGILGNNSAASQSSPVSVFGGRSYSQINMNANFCAALEASTGNVYCWGLGTNGYLGSGNSNNASSPVSVVGGRSFNQILSLDGNVTFAKEASTGQLFGWGDNTFYQLGFNAFAQFSPTAVAGSRSYNYLSGNSTCLTTIEASTGNLYSWGRNNVGQVGNNTIANVSSPASVVGGRSYSKIITGNTTVASIEASTGNAYCWGTGTSGQLGNGTILSQSSPVSVQGGRSFNQINITAGGSTTLAIEASTGNAYSWGDNTAGQLGNNNSLVLTSSSPLSVVGGRSYSSIVQNGTSNGAFAIEASTGNAYAWGNNANGQLGNNNANNQSSPTSVVGGRSFNSIVADITISTVAAIEASTGNAYCWGSGSNGQIGNNNNTARSSPISVFGGRSFSNIFASDGTVAAIEASTGNAYCWGLGTSGQLGNNNIVNQSSPNSVVGGRSYSKISMLNGAAIVAIEASTGNAYMWGLNSSGQLGNGTIVNASSPTSVIGGRSYTSLVQPYFTQTTMVGAIEGSTGIVYMWGTDSNSYGVLGNNQGVANTSPVSIVGIVNF